MNCLYRHCVDTGSSPVASKILVEQTQGIYPEKLNLKLLVFKDPKACYSFNDLIFVKTPNGKVYAAMDSGCSCPIPFEDFEGETWQECTAKMEETPDSYSAILKYGSWVGQLNLYSDGTRRVLNQSDDRRKIEEFFEDELKNS